MGGILTDPDCRTVAESRTRVFVIGDSTAASYSAERYPLTGWGQVLSSCFDDDISVSNRAQSGASSKSFYHNYWNDVINDMKAGDYLIIQFGHNDSKTTVSQEDNVPVPDPNRYTDPNADHTAQGSYKWYLNKYVEAAREKGAFPVIATSIERRRVSEEGEFSHSDDLLNYSRSAREFAALKDVPLIDMNVATFSMYLRFGAEGSKKLFLIAEAGVYTAYPDGKTDNTHLSEFGAHEIAGVFACELLKSDVPLKNHVKSRINKSFYVRDFLEDGITDSQCIESCLSQAARMSRNPTIIFDQRDWYIDRAILLPSNTTVIIDGCMIKQNNEVFDNVFRGDNLRIDSKNLFGAPLEVYDLENIKILGKNGAKIVGCDVNRKGYHSVLNETQDMVGDFWGWRTLQISLSKCKGFEISGIEFTKTRCWAMSFDFCSEGYIHDIHIISNVKNGDGIDFRVGCHHCRVENITGSTSDDTVACTALYNAVRTYPHKNYLYPLEPAKAVFSGDDMRQMDIHNISISGIYTGGMHHGVICLAANGLRVHHIHISKVHEGREGVREAAVKLYTGYGTEYNDNDINHITIESVESTISKYAVMCNAKVDKVELIDIVQHNPDGEQYSLAHTDGIVILAD